MDTNAQAIFEKRIAQHIAVLTYQHLTRSGLVRDLSSSAQGELEDDDPLLYVWMQAGRVVLAVNPLRVKNLGVMMRPRFKHHLGTVLQGRRVVVTNHRGIFFQVDYYPEAQGELQALPLDLSTQPNAQAVPIGVTMNGALWLSLTELDAVLIGGSRRMGKTNLLHGWILALLQGDATRLMLFDGKGGVEFAPYANCPRVHVVTGELAPALADIFAEMLTRFDALKDARVSSIGEYNRGRGAGARLERIVLIVDELAYALQEAGVEAVLVDLTARGGAVGVHPILATQRPSSGVVTPRLKGNLMTRIALPVPDRASSFVVLDRAGAESIAKTPGRLLLSHGARLVEAQAFKVVGGDATRVTGDEAKLAMPPSARLSDREQRLAQAALERGGRFVIRDIAKATGERIEYVNAVAKKWQVLGYLSEVKRNEHGHKQDRARDHTSPCGVRAELGVHRNLGNLAELGELGRIWRNLYQSNTLPRLAVQIRLR